MKNVILYFFLASFAANAIAMDNEESNVLFRKAAEYGVEATVVPQIAYFLLKVDRNSLARVCTRYTEYVAGKETKVFEAYTSQVNSLLSCNSIFDLTAEHFEFFHHMQNYFPELLDRTLEGDLTALHKAILSEKTIPMEFLLAFDVNCHIPGLVPDEAHPEGFKRITTAELLNEKATEAWVQYFKGKSWSERKEKLKEGGGNLWNARTYLWPFETNNRYSNQFQFCEFLDVLIHNPNDAIDHSGYDPILNTVLNGAIQNPTQYLSLFINAGRALDIENLREDYFTQLIDNEALRNFVFEKKLVSSKAIERAIRHFVQKVCRKGEGLEALKWVLSHRRLANVHADNGEECTWSIALENVRPYCSSGNAKMLELFNLLLSAGADPHYVIDVTGSEAAQRMSQMLLSEGKDPNSTMWVTNSSGAPTSPVIKLLNAADTPHYRMSESFTIYIDLLEISKTSKLLKMDEITSWAGNHKNWAISPLICKFFVTNGIDPLMACVESTPFQHALNEVSHEKNYSDRPIESIKIMYPYCRDRLRDKQLTFAPNSNFMGDHLELICDLINQGVTCKEWAQNHVFAWISHPQLCEVLIKTKNIDLNSKKSKADPGFDEGLASKNGTPLFIAFKGWSSWNHLSSDADHHSINNMVFQSIEIMVPYCAEQLKAHPITLTHREKSQLEKIGKLGFFLSNGFILPGSN